MRAVRGISHRMKEQEWRAAENLLLNGWSLGPETLMSFRRFYQAQVFGPTQERPHSKIIDMGCQEVGEFVRSFAKTIDCPSCRHSVILTRWLRDKVRTLLNIYNMPSTGRGCGRCRLAESWPKPNG